MSNATTPHPKVLTVPSGDQARVIAAATRAKSENNAHTKVTFGRTHYVSPALLIYAGLLQFTFATFIAPTFGYLGSRYRDPDVLNYSVAALMLLAVTPLLPKHLTKASDLVSWLLFGMNIVPAALVPHYADIISADSALGVSAIACISFTATLLALRSSTPTWVPTPRRRASEYWAAVLVLSVACSAYIVSVNGLPQLQVGFEAIKSLRYEYRDQIARTGPLLGYVVRLSGNVLNPMLIGYGVFRKRPLYLAAGLAGQAVSYSATGFKLTLLSPLAIALLPYLLSRPNARAVRVLMGLVGTTVAAIVVDTLLNSIYLTEVLVDRLLLIPGTLTAAHFMIFSGQPKAHWSYSFLEGITNSPYSETPSILVGRLFSGNAEISANANYIADGYANWGIPGIAVETMALILLLRLLDSASRGLNPRFVATVTLMPTLSLVNSGIFTAVITGGFLAALIALALAPETKDAAEDPVPSPKSRPQGPGMRRARYRNKNQ